MLNIFLNNKDMNRELGKIKNWFTALSKSHTAAAAAWPARRRDMVAVSCWTGARRGGGDFIGTVARTFGGKMNSRDRAQRIHASVGEPQQLLQRLGN